MKRPLLFLLLLLFSYNVFGQRIRFCDTGNVWKIKSTYYGGPISSSIGNFLLKGGFDTVYHNVHYLAVLYGVGYYLLREDTIQGKVYFVALPNYGGSQIDTNEAILYDYNWKAGDTIVRKFDNEHYKHLVAGVDFVTIRSESYKVWHFKDIDTGITLPSGNFDVIEGIGSIDHPFFPARPMRFELGSQLLCFSNNGTTPIVSPAVDYFDNAISCTLAVDELQKSQPASVYPNPITPSTRISLPYMMKNGIVQIINTIGQVIWQRAVTNEKEVWIGDKITVDGMYYYRLSDESSGSVFTGKLKK